MATASRTAKGICIDVPQALLDSPISDIHIAQLAKDMTEWQELAPFLDLSPAEEGSIIEQYRGRLPLQKREALRKWKEKNGNTATYRKLIVIYCSQGKAALAETVKNLLMSKNQSIGSAAPNSDVIDVFHDYLHDCYSDLPHPSSLQWPNYSNECYIELELLDVPMNGDNAELCKPIPLKSIFTAGNSKTAKRKVILIEGIAGVGKTTLSWHACKEWAAGRLFEDMKLLIHVSLSDPVLHSASELADLIPHPSAQMRTNVAKAIADKRCKGICFLLEGCDEAPQSLWESFLYRFVVGIGGRSMLPGAHIILTSRPGIPARVAKCLTGKVITRGFNLLDYINVLQLENKDQLRQALTMRPELYSLCHLPLNAVILVYLHDNFADKLPSTRTGLFDLFVRNFLLRHMQTRTTYREITFIDNFPADLPSDILSSLTTISKLAYRSLLLERKRIIDQSGLWELGLHDIDNAFGFLQVHQRLTMRGLHKQFSFIHLAFQEFLAAFHISQMDEHQQVKAVKLVFDQNPLSPVLTFYAGITDLNNNEVQDILLKVLKEPIDIDGILKGLGLSDPNTIIDNINPAHDPRRHMLALMNCMYEAQNVNLFAHVKLPPSASVHLTDERIQNSRSSILLLGMLLFPTDCLAIGYFVRHAISQTSNMVCNIDLSCCLLGDMQIEALAIELQKPVHKDNVAISLFFSGVYISTRAIKLLAALLTSDSYVSQLGVEGDLIENSALFLKYCIEGFLLHHYSLPKLGLGLGSIHHIPNIIYYLILLLRCPCLRYLDLSSGNHLLFANPSTTPLFCEALRYSHLRRLNLSDCGLDDDSLKSLMTIVCQRHCKVQILYLLHNPYTEQGLTCSLNILWESVPFVQLCELAVNHFSDDHKKILKIIDDIREYHHQPQLIVNETDKFLLRIKNKERIKGVAMLNYYTFMRPDLALPSLHH